LFTYDNVVPQVNILSVNIKGFIFYAKQFFRLTLVDIISFSC